jgi:hypothetical protein
VGKRFLVVASLLFACGDDEAPAETGAETPEIASAPAPPPEQGKDAPPASSGGGPNCGSGADVELEPNETPQAATAVLQLKFCGVLADGDDVDHFTFTTPQGTKLGVFQAVVTVPLDIAITVNGQTYAPGDPRLATSGTFVVKVSARAGKPSAYQARIQYDPT